uniref:Uncharacterized protein n=1 Tax=Daphnia magna TaxID=35525 RepID=A0A0P6CK50_9CRUS
MALRPITLHKLIVTGCDFSRAIKINQDSKRKRKRKIKQNWKWKMITSVKSDDQSTERSSI